MSKRTRDLGSAVVPGRRLYVPAEAASASKIETAGKAVAYALPLVAVGVSLAHHEDWDGVAELGVSTAATLGAAYLLSTSCANSGRIIQTFIRCRRTLRPRRCSATIFGPVMAGSMGFRPMRSPFRRILARRCEETSLVRCGSQQRHRIWSKLRDRDALSRK